MANTRGGKANGIVYSDEVFDNLTVNTATTLPAGTTIGGSTVAALGVVTSASANAVSVGLAGATNPAFNVDASTATQAAGLNVIGAATGGTVALNAIDSGANTSISISPKGTGLLTLKTMVNKYTPQAINATAAATAAQVASGYITSTSAAATTITLPTGTLLGAALGAVQGTAFELYIDNTAGANTVTMAVAVNGILSAAAAAGAGAGAGLLTIPNGVTGQACFTLMFSSATAYTFSRTA
jgi:hypothetical protein